MPPRYDILAIDLDGTLLNSRAEVSERNRRAVIAARAAGLRVVVCTGRGLVECRPILERIGQAEPVVVAGGSIIADPVTGRTLRRFPVHLDLARRTAEHLVAAGHPALVLKDPAETGYDYLVVHGRPRLPLDPVTEWWFGKLNVRVRYAEHIDEDEHPGHTVRVGACGLSGTLAGVKRDLLAAVDGKAQVHHFPAVVAPEHASRCADGQALHILELFDECANKWSAVSHLAEEWRVAPGRIAAIGDEINDECMIRAAGLGIAMGNAVPEVRAAARGHTLPHDEDGVAHAIGRILAGEW